jgi:hypothetical protein
MLGEARDERGGAALAVGAAFEQIETGQRPGGFDSDDEPAAAGRIKAAALKFGVNADAHSIYQRQIRLSEKVERRSAVIVRAAFEYDARGPIGNQ